MKKIILLILLVLCFSCKKKGKTRESVRKDEGQEKELLPRVCGSYDVLQEQIKGDVKLSIKLKKIEDFINKMIREGRVVGNKLEIPVVVNILYRTPEENVSNEQVQTQIDVLNRDFNGLNCDFGSVPTEFSTTKTNVGISFVLQNIVRRAVTTASWTTKDSMKKSYLGIVPTTPTKVLNIWVCNMAGGILGYAQFPGGPSAVDGIVLDNNAFGTIGTAAAPFNLGRTATHEVGHWMNLRHIWGDANCGDDFVMDTPTHDSPNFGNPVYPHHSTCPGNPVEMTMNYMDYTNDSGMYMFSHGQKTRMLSIFMPGGPRQSFAQP